MKKTILLCMLLGMSSISHASGFSLLKGYYVGFSDTNSPCSFEVLDESPGFSPVVNMTADINDLSSRLSTSVSRSLEVSSENLVNFSNLTQLQVHASMNSELGFILGIDQSGRLVAAALIDADSGGNRPLIKTCRNLMPSKKDRPY